MFGGAGVRRAVVLIAAALLLVVPARAQSEADKMVEKFAGETDRAQSRKAEAARKAAHEARAKKEADRKAAHAKRVLAIRKEAEAQRAAAIARLKAEEAGVTEEQKMLERARREAEETTATADIRRLIEEAEGARIRAEAMLAEEAERARIKAATPAGTEAEQELQRVSQEAQRRGLQDATDRAALAEQARLKAARAAEHRRRLASLARVRQARLTAQGLRVAQEARAAQAADEQARLAIARAAETRRLRTKLTRVASLRRARLAATARHLAQEAEVARAGADEAARLALTRAAENRQAVKRLARVREVREARLIALSQRLAAAEAANQRPAQEAEAARRTEPESQLGVASRALGGRTEVQPPAVVASTDPPGERPVAEPFAGRPGFRGEPDWRVTVLMIMAPGTYGIRRGASIADPVLCTNDGCYVSIGADSAAIFMPRRKALGVGNTLGGRAGACRQSLSCVFRDVALEYPAVLQPVDLHILKHDRRRPQRILADSDCRLAAGRLTCSRGIYAEDYVLWIVPERLADTAGPETLERALRDGLSASRSAEAAPRPVQ
jgi:hypothetical protein